MKDPKSSAAIEMRLKYDWVVLLFGLLCVVAQLLFEGDLVYFFASIGFFAMVEIFSVRTYRNLLKGGEGCHMQTRQTLDQQSSVELLVFCMAVDLVFLTAFFIIFFVKLLR
jgi:hypothetical protein